MFSACWKRWASRTPCSPTRIVPPAQEMRDALTGKLITNIPLGTEFIARFGQPYAVTHRADIHGDFPACLPELEPDHAGE